MNKASRGELRWRCHWQWVALLLVTGAINPQAQVCLSAADMELPVRTALETAAKRYFDMSVHGDTAALKQDSIPMMATNFAGVENAIKANQLNFAGASATIRPPFLLNAEGSEPLARAEFLCGVFGPSGQTSQSAVFVLQNLPPGKYGVAILDVIGGKEPRTLTLVLQLVGQDWKLAGYYLHSPQAAGHDGAWYTQKARDFKASSQNHNAWLYYREATGLTSPVDFMSTQATDRLYDEIQALQPIDMPTDGKPVDLVAGGKIYHLTAMFPLAVDDDLDVVVRYSSPDISNTRKTYEDNMQVIKALIAKFPELRTAFAGIVARAVDPAGHDYGSLLPMKEIK